MSTQENQETKTVVAETPKAAEQKPTTEVKPKATPVNERLYKFIAQPSIPPKGKQRQIVLSIMAGSKEPLTVGQVAKAATTAGLTAVGGVEPSCRYHLHHLEKLGFVEVINPKTNVETVAA